jgi:hypothetical protein
MELSDPDRFHFILPRGLEDLTEGDGKREVRGSIWASVELPPKNKPKQAGLDELNSG